MNLCHQCGSYTRYLCLTLFGIAKVSIRSVAYSSKLRRRRIRTAPERCLRICRRTRRHGFRTTSKPASAGFFMFGIWRSERVLLPQTRSGLATVRFEVRLIKSAADEATLAPNRLAWRAGLLSYVPWRSPHLFSRIVCRWGDVHAVGLGVRLCIYSLPDTCAWKFRRAVTARSATVVDRTPFPKRYGAFGGWPW